MHKPLIPEFRESCDAEHSTRLMVGITGLNETILLFFEGIFKTLVLVITFSECIMTIRLHF